MDLPLIILILSILAQFVAAIKALSLFGKAERLYAWVFVATALLLMGVRRTVTFFQILSTDKFIIDPIAESVALVISLLMLTGVWLIGSVFKKMGRMNSEMQSELNKREQAEEALRKSEEKYRLMVESSYDAVTIIQNGKFMYVNDSLAQMLGKKRSQLISKDYKTYFKEDALNQIKDIINRADRNNKGPYRFQTIFTRDDGSDMNVEANASIINYKDEEAIFAVIRDITEQTQIFQKLQKSAKQTEGLENYISICAGCHKIQDKNKNGRPWISPADYITERLPDIKFTHGMCPDCMQKWYPDYIENESSDKDSD